MSSSSQRKVDVLFDIDQNILREMYFNFLRIRRIEEEISKRYKEQKMRCPTHLCVGQEAIAVGISAHLKNTDYVTSTHRAHAHYLACGGSLDKFIAELYGKETGCSGGRGGSMHLIDKEAGFMGCVPIVGSTISIATGLAFETKRKNEKKVSVVYFGDGATEEGVFYESLNFAKFHQLPILFVCENNQNSVVTPYNQRRIERQKLSDVASAFNVDVSIVDGQKVEEIFYKSSVLIQEIRAGEGPKFLEIHTRLLVEHCGPQIFDDESLKKTLDPLASFQEKLIKTNFIDKNLIEVYEEKIKNEITKAFDKAENDPFPLRKNLMSHIFWGDRP